MSAPIKNLNATHVHDVMNRDVVTLPAFATMEEAASVFALHDIRGAPVVDESGRCIGIISTTDFARLDEMESQCGCSSHADKEFVLAQNGNAEPLHIEHAAADCIRQHMSCAPQSIDEKRSLIDAARYMLGQHTHRLIVIDEHGRPVGVLSTLDILAALVDCAEE